VLKALGLTDHQNVFEVNLLGSLAVLLLGYPTSAAEDPEKPGKGRETSGKGAPELLKTFKNHGRRRSQRGRGYFFTRREVYWGLRGDAILYGSLPCNRSPGTFLASLSRHTAPGQGGNKRLPWFSFLGRKKPEDKVPRF
jgi:hypothetical protein